MFLVIGLNSARAQAPGLLWSTNVGAKLFAVDSQTNAYAQIAGTVIKISSAGVPLETNAICPRLGVAQRDAAGNFYFAGSLEGTQNFGGITLVGTSSGFLAKYNSAGSLLQAVQFPSTTFNGLIVTDLLVDSDGRALVGFMSAWKTVVTRIEGSGAISWQTQISRVPTETQSQHINFGGLTSSNCSYFRYDRNLGTGTGVQAGRIDLAGNYSAISPQQDQYSAGFTNGRPVIDDAANIFYTGRITLDFERKLHKYGPGSTVIWTRQLPDIPAWILARDTQANVYLGARGPGPVGGPTGKLSKFDVNGEFVWSRDDAYEIIHMIVDPSGNRFLGFANGGVARLASDPPVQAPAPLISPPSPTVFFGDAYSLSVTTSGTLPIKYSWQFNGVTIPGATNTTYDVGSAASANAGSYTVVATNLVGVVTSAPALVRVKQVQLYLGSQLLTNGTYVFPSPPTLNVRSAFANGSKFYTLDGSTPSFASTPYSGPFTVLQSATVRAVGYSADFGQSEEADAVNIVVLANHTLSATASAGGGVSLNPPGGNYVSTNTVTVTALPAPGYSFAYWLGDVAGTNPSIQVSMEHDKSLHAVFGTTLATSAVGGGQVQLDPPGGFYPLGTTVRLTAIPNPGNYFGAWGNAASGNTNPLYFTISAPTQTVSSVFGATPVGQAALTLLINGNGRVTASPRANAYALNSGVTLTAVPDSGQSFISWSGDASGTQNPLPITMSAAKTIIANFSERPFLRVDRPGIEGLTGAGFRFTLVADPPAVHQVFGSTNLSSWSLLGSVTNNFREAQFLDANATTLPMRYYKAIP